MRTLTIDDNWKDWKFGDTDAVMTFTAQNDGQTPDFTDKTLTFKIADSAASTPDNPKDYVASAAGYVENNKVLLKTEDVKTLTPGTYSVELWVMDNSTEKNAIYPSKGFAFFSIEENTMKVSDITNVPSKTLEAIYADLKQQLGAIKKGSQGELGKTPKIVMGSVTKLSPDAQPSATLVPLQSDPNTYTLNLQLPQGVQGEQGLQGIPGVGSKGLDGNNGLTPTIDPKTKHWMIGGTDTGVIAEGQAGKDADPSKYVPLVSFNDLRQKVQDNAASLDALQKSTVNKDLKAQIAELLTQVSDLTKQVKALQEAKSNTPKSDEPAKSDDDTQTAKSDTPSSSADPAFTPTSSSTTSPDSTPASSSSSDTSDNKSASSSAETSAAPASNADN
ncbi:MAG: hypothetical protein K2O77_08625 [Limosilactobacillus sp.]|uniref:hypothetical protein n=1 Tax=Limosilactobacillus sp. TaxID=2773925 RepID=UPI0023D52EF4|nr:hypothetical protein [Limosilactobacillus sp.]MDE7040976.1 hypothetical protein [Limosilactobacillus sp.]